MNKNRRSMGAVVAVFNGCLVVDSGWNGPVRLASQEYCNDPPHRWQIVPTLMEESVCKG